MEPVYLIPVQRHKPPLEDLGEYTDCPLCGWHANVHNGRISEFHSTENGVLCAAGGMCLTVEAAIERDGQLNPAEKAAAARVFRNLISCKGPLADPECHHPICRERVDKGLAWTLSGWRSVDSRLALF
jgi:hypothetical protein